MNILVVDDESLVRKSLKRAFMAKGHQVVAAAGGQEGIELWQKAQPDVVLLDVLMPDMTGPEVLKEMLPNSAHVILMSAFKGKYNSDSVKNLGASDFMPKPFDDIFAAVSYVERSYEQARTTSCS